MLDLIKKELRKKSSKKKAYLLQGFFKTSKGQYGEGDVFLGVVVPEIRRIVKKYWQNVSLADALKLLESKYHEERLCALFILVEKFQKGYRREKLEIYSVYLKNTKFINNWDLVDLTSPKIIGAFLYDFNRPRKVLYQLAKSNNLWERRISVLATAYFISKGDFKDTLKIAEMLLSDKHDLIHKAVGWMLREIGKRELSVLERFLKRHYKRMPRTMLRYAIERFPDKKRRAYLSGTAQ